MDRASAKKENEGLTSGRSSKWIANVVPSALNSIFSICWAVERSPTFKYLFRL